MGLCWVEVVGGQGGKALCSWPDTDLKKKGWVMGRSFCLRLRPLLNLIKALLTHHNKADRPLGALLFSFTYKSDEKWD